MARHGRDLGELLEHLDLTDVTLVGASMGGNTIWAYVDQFGSCRLAGVLIDDQTPKMINTADWPYGFYGFTPENAGTYFAAGIPPTTPERNRAAVRSGDDAFDRATRRAAGVPRLDRAGDPRPAQRPRAGRLAATCSRVSTSRS